ncbi:hypothetical protein D9M68_891220 [compost metagenome]
MVFTVKGTLAVAADRRIFLHPSVPLGGELSTPDRLEQAWPIERLQSRRRMHGYRVPARHATVAAATNHFPERQVDMFQRSREPRQQQLLGSAVAVPDGDRSGLP